MTHIHGLSKSRITSFEQCPRKLWLSVHNPDAAEYDDNAEMRFSAGNEVGEIACRLHPEGVMIEAEPDLAAAVVQTRTLIDSDHPGPFFEATFEHEGVLVRVDVLARDGDDRWQMAEVKSSTGVKDYHRGDVATQIWVVRQNGIELSAASVRHVDREFVLAEEGTYDGLFADADLQHSVEGIISGRRELVAAARNVLAGPEPDRATGEHCSSPFECEFRSHCDAGADPGPEWPCTILPQGSGRKWAAKGHADLLELPTGDLSPMDARIQAATRDDIPYHDVEGAAAEMADWSYPRAWLDFETIGQAVPRWIGTRPYQQVPFQFSLHLETSEGVFRPEGFLSTDGSDPRRECAARLVEWIPPDATIIAYSAQFERRVLRDLARNVPEHGEALLGMAERVVDLLPVTRKHWYHRDQRGSWSIKAVLPTVSDLDYAALGVSDGQMAQLAWAEAASPDCSAERHDKLRRELIEYCRQDTWAMVVLARHLVGKDIPEDE